MTVFAYSRRFTAKEIDPKRFDDHYSLIEPELNTAEDGAKYYLLPPHHYGLGVRGRSRHSKCREM
jgi:hypothetical protein